MYWNLLTLIYSNILLKNEDNLDEIIYTRESIRSLTKKIPLLLNLIYSQRLLRTVIRIY
jgi:hypothetical protein